MYLLDSLKKGYLRKGYERDRIVVLNKPFICSRYGIKDTAIPSPEIFMGHHRAGALIAMGQNLVEVIIAKDDQPMAHQCYGKLHNAYKRIKYNYGLEKNEYALLKKTTGNYCPICNYKLKEIGIRNKNMTNCIDHNKNDKKLGIEHNHRGIICDGCNTGTKITNIIELLRKRIIFIQIHELFVGRLDVKQFRKEILFLRKNGLLDKNWDTKPIFKFHICLNKILDERKNKNNKMDFYLIKQTTAYKNIE